MKKVQIQMSDECHTVLKTYAALFGMTMSDAMYHFTRQEIHHHALHCKCVQQLLDGQNIKSDKRAGKECWGYKCLVCKHSSMCRAGLTDKSFDPKDEIKKSLKESSPLHQLYRS